MSVRVALFSACLLVPLLCFGASVDDTDGYTHSLRSDRVDGVHTDFDTDLAPVQMGPLTISLRTTNQRLEILEHELELGAAEDRVDQARLTARYQGEADLVATLELAGVSSEIEDHLVLPLQETEVAGRVELVPEEEGLRVVTVENPEHVAIEVESNLADRLEQLCQGFALMALGSLDCSGVEQALSVVKVPLPEPGREFFIAFDDLTPHERQQIEEYLRRRRASSAL